MLFTISKVSNAFAFSRFVRFWIVLCVCIVFTVIYLCIIIFDWLYVIIITTSSYLYMCIYCYIYITIHICMSSGNVMLWRLGQSIGASPLVPIHWCQSVGANTLVPTHWCNPFIAIVIKHNYMNLCIINIIKYKSIVIKKLIK